MIDIAQAFGSREASRPNDGKASGSKTGHSIRRIGMVLGATLVAAVLSSVAPASAQSVETAASARLAYPLKASANHRYLVDQGGKPALIIGDAPHTLFANLSLSQANQYFKSRASYGINILWAELLCDPYVLGRPDLSTYDGIAPFLRAGDFSTPNPAYFARVDAMIKLAAQYDITIFLDTMETGGLINTVVANGPRRNYDWGAYLGNRYKDFPNIVWITGNDFQDWRTRPDENNDIAQIMRGIRDTDKNHLQTDQLDYNVSASLDDYLLVPYLGLSGVYTYYPTYAETLAEYNRARNVPIFLEEANYEFEANNGAKFDIGNAATLRRQGYWALLSGATGQMYGNHYTWTFAAGWQQKLATPGARELRGLKLFFSRYRWWDLVPDQGHKQVIAGYGTFASTGSIHTNDYVTAAGTEDGSLLIAYCPTKTTLTVDMTTLRGQITAQWFDPTNNTYVTIGGSPFANVGTQNFVTPGPNSAFDRDWVLVLRGQ